MTEKYAISARKLFLSFISAGLALSLFCGMAAAQAIPGCDDDVKEAMEKKSEAKVAVDVAVTEEIVKKPDSVLALTCFNKAAGTIAARGGAIFSGDFTSVLTPTVKDSLEAMYDDFADAEGFDTAGVVNYAATALVDDPSCDGIQNLWGQIKNKGVTGGVPYATFGELLSGTLPAGAGGNFIKNWSAALTNGTFSDLNSALASLPNTPIPNFSGSTSSCQVLLTAGVIPGPCP